MISRTLLWSGQFDIKNSQNDLLGDKAIANELWVGPRIGWGPRIYRTRPFSATPMSHDRFAQKNEDSKYGKSEKVDCYWQGGQRTDKHPQMTARGVNEAPRPINSSAAEIERFMKTHVGIDAGKFWFYLPWIAFKSTLKDGKIVQKIDAPARRRYEAKTTFVENRRRLCFASTFM